MCGRYTLAVEIEEVVEVFDVATVRFDGPDLPRYNIAPTQMAPAIVQAEEGRRMGALRWGLIPSRAAGPSVGSRLINARSETVGSKPSFREAFARRRCLVPADGFFEWQASPAGGPKRPHWLHRPGGELFSLAGLWEGWGAGRERIYSFTLLTTAANPWMRPLHDRMPVVVDPPARDLWLREDTPRSTLEGLLHAPGDDFFVATEVSTRVNSPANDDLGCIQPLGDAVP